jgi:predicted histone-like DNA-binding protein
MATNKIEMLYNLKQNNIEGSKSYGLWYPKVVHRSTLNLRGLAQHIADHGSPYTPDIVYGVLTKMVSCLVELVEQGMGVKLDGLGIFHPTLESKGAETPINYDINANLQGVHIRFRPEGVEEDNITSRVFKHRVQMRQNMIFDKNGVPKKVVDGQLVDYGNEDDGNDNG